jgi:hypothetical protein
MAKKTKTAKKPKDIDEARRERRERVLEQLRAKGIDRETLWNVQEQFFTERNEAELNAARMFFTGGSKITPSDFNERLSDASSRCNGVLAAAMSVADASCDKDLSNGLIQLINDLLGHLNRLERAFNAEVWIDKMEARAK